MVALSLLLIPNSLDLGHWMGDTATDHTIAIVLAIIGFWILDVSNNTLQGRSRERTMFFQKTTTPTKSPKISKH